MNISRQNIIAVLREHFEREPEILAMWLEGADAVQAVDAYSDIDVCCSVAAGAMLEVTNLAHKALASLAPVDLAQPLTVAEDMTTTVFHLAGTSAYMLVDFSVYVARGSDFIAGDEIEKPLVLFERGSVIRYHDPDLSLRSQERNQRLQELQNTVVQAARIEKYVQRGDFLEAYGYYQKWLLTPLIELLRMKYTPLHPDYYIVHISRHLPVDVRIRLEELFKVNSVAEIEVKSQEALVFFEEVVTQVSGSPFLKGGD
jgi:hypothetical protein